MLYPYLFSLAVLYLLFFQQDLINMIPGMLYSGKQFLFGFIAVLTWSAIALRVVEGPAGRD